MSLRSFVVAAGALILLPLGAAWAAPQPLGLIASKQPLQLRCADGKCAGFLSSFCMLKERRAPHDGEVYQLAADDQVQVVVTGRDGATHSLPSTDLIKFEAYMSYTAVRVEVDQTRLAALDPVAVSVRVAPRATLLPEPSVAFKRPLTKSEIALVTGPLRAAAEPIFEEGSARNDAVRVTGLLVNELPFGDLADGQFETAWQNVATSVGGANPEGLAVARRSYLACRNTVAHELYATLRTCVARKHQRLILDMNKEYWDNSGGV
jgi:hypothetical protein